MLKSGILGQDGFRKTDVGSTQGSICSPILANIFAHYAIDIWMKGVVESRLEGEMLLARYCDDFVICCNKERDAKRIMLALPKRLNRFSLKINESKTKLEMHKSKFGPKFKPGTFDFLGFSFFIGKTRTGHSIPKVRTSAKKFRKRVKEINAWCRKYRHKYPMATLWKFLRRKIIGYMQYFCVSNNLGAVSMFIRRVEEIFFKWMNRRSQRKSFTWDKYILFLGKNPMPRPRVITKLF